VSDGPKIVEMVRNTFDASRRIYTLGLGSGVSRYLVESVAEAGNGLHEYVGEEEDLNAKVMYLLQDSITPFLDMFKISPAASGL